MIVWVASYPRRATGSVARRSGRRSARSASARPPGGALRNDLRPLLERLGVATTTPCRHFGRSRRRSSSRPTASPSTSIGCRRAHAASCSGPAASAYPTDRGQPGDLPGQGWPRLPRLLRPLPEGDRESSPLPADEPHRGGRGPDQAPDPLWRLVANVGAWRRREGPTEIVRFEELIEDPVRRSDAATALGVELAEPRPRRRRSRSCACAAAGRNSCAAARPGRGDLSSRPSCSTSSGAATGRRWRRSATRASLVPLWRRREGPTSNPLRGALLGGQVGTRHG